VHRQRQTDRDRLRQAAIEQTESQMDRKTRIHRQTSTQTGQTNTQQTDRTDGQTDRHTDRQTYRQTESEI
jgi:hypothetical protein